MKKKSLQLHLFEPPGRSTGNRIIFMDSLRGAVLCQVRCTWSPGSPGQYDQIPGVTPPGPGPVDPGELG